MTRSERRCILCEGKSKRLFDWSLRDVKNAYQEKFRDPFPDAAVCPAYAMMECAECGLVFADPPVPGNSNFYAWITGFANYYQAFRWEWGVVRDIIVKTQSASLLEIGCGTGNFLSFATAGVEISAIGLDTHAPSVALCKTKNLNAACMDMEEFSSQYPDSTFDVVCAFHCLEHVSDPRSMVQSMARVLSPNGCVILSVPYSPRSDEVLALDAMNLPPHHLTRWNQNTLMRLGELVGLDIELQTDDGAFGGSAIKSVFWHFLSNFDGASNASLFRNFVRATCHPIIFFNCVRFFITRDRVAGKRAGDVVLAILRKRA